MFESSSTFYAKSSVCLLVLATFGSTGYHVENSIRSSTLCSAMYLFHSLFRTVWRLPGPCKLTAEESNRIRTVKPLQLQTVRWIWMNSECYFSRTKRSGCS